MLNKTDRKFFFLGDTRTSRRAHFCFTKAQSVISRSTPDSGIVGVDTTARRVPAE